MCVVYTHTYTYIYTHAHIHRQTDSCSVEPLNCSHAGAPPCLLAASNETNLTRSFFILFSYSKSLALVLLLSLCRTTTLCRRKHTNTTRKAVMTSSRARAHRFLPVSVYPVHGLWSAWGYIEKRHFVQGAVQRE